MTGFPNMIFSCRNVTIFAQKMTKIRTILQQKYAFFSKIREYYSVLKDLNGQIMLKQCTYNTFTHQTMKILNKFDTGNDIKSHRMAKTFF